MSVVSKSAMKRSGSGGIALVRFSPRRYGKSALPRVSYTGSTCAKARRPDPPMAHYSTGARPLFAPGLTRRRFTVDFKARVAPDALRWRRDLHGWPGSVHGQYLHRAAVTVARIRGGLPARAHRRLQGRAGHPRLDGLLQQPHSNF